MVNLNTDWPNELDQLLGRNKLVVRTSSAIGPSQAHVLAKMRMSQTLGGSSWALTCLSKDFKKERRDLLPCGALESQAFKNRQSFANGSVIDHSSAFDKGRRHYYRDPAGPSKP